MHVVALPSVKVKQQKSSLAPSGVGVLQERLVSSASGFSPATQENGSPPPEQSTLESALQFAGGVIVTVALPPVEDDEHPALARADAPRQNSKPPTVFQT
jgi:hypothetical protein